jgi:hypothetical protein
MHYQVIAGGNAFYEKRTAKAGQRNRTQMEAARSTRRKRPERIEPEVQIAQAPRRRAAPVYTPQPVSVPSYEPEAAVVAYSPGLAPASIEDLILAE